MRDLYEVLRQKEIDIVRVREEIEALPLLFPRSPRTATGSNTVSLCHPLFRSLEGPYHWREWAATNRRAADALNLRGFINNPLCQLPNYREAWLARASQQSDGAGTVWRRRRDCIENISCADGWQRTPVLLDRLARRAGRHDSRPARDAVLKLIY